MSLEIDYLPVATGTGANVDSQANFSGSSYQTLGVQRGIATSSQANKIWRQSSMMSAALASVISSTLNIPVLDDGNLAALITNLTNTVITTNAPSTQTIGSPNITPLVLSSTNTTGTQFIIENSNEGSFWNMAFSGPLGNTPGSLIFVNSTTATPQVNVFALSLSATGNNMHVPLSMLGANINFLSAGNGILGPLGGTQQLNDDGSGTGGWNFGVASGSTLGIRFWKGGAGTTLLASISPSGTFSATTKNFQIPYPGDSTKLLNHSSLEGPEIGVFYRGTSQLVNGAATITLPVYFEALTLTTERTVLLSRIYTAGQAPADLAYTAPANGEFTVYAQNADGSINTASTQSFSWEVKAVRSDQPALEVVVAAPTEA